MEIEIITTTTNSTPSSTSIDTTIEDNKQIPIEEVPTKEIEKLSNIEIINITDIVLADVLEYLIEETEFEHMRDEVINQRIRTIIKDKHYNNIKQSIINLFKFLNEDDNVLEWIEFRGKLTYGIDNDIDEVIYDNVFVGTKPYIFDIAKCWLSWDDYNSRFANHTNFLGHEILINSIIKNVFQALGNGFEYINNESDSDNTSTISIEEKNILNTNENTDENTDEETNESNIQCVIC